MKRGRLNGPAGNVLPNKKALKEDYSEWSVEKLKSELKSRGLAVSGRKKEDLIPRLVRNDAEQRLAPQSALECGCGNVETVFACDVCAKLFCSAHCPSYCQKCGEANTNQYCEKCLEKHDCEDFL